MQITAPSSRIIHAFSDQSGSRGFEQHVAEEVPVSFTYSGFSHAVMMATPNHLEDFAYGFSLTEGIIRDVSDIRDLTIESNDGGWRAHVSLETTTLHRYLAQRRIRMSRGHTSCGICGAQDFQDVFRPFDSVPSAKPVKAEEILTALAALREFQPLSRATKGTHASAWVSEGNIVAVREDVGRHNSLDKLIGAGICRDFLPSDGFCLITSRCSFEMAQKAIAASYPLLVSVSAPTALAIRTAIGAGLTLASLSRDGHLVVYAAPTLQKGSQHGDKT